MDVEAAAQLADGSLITASYVDFDSGDLRGIFAFRKFTGNGRLVKSFGQEGTVNTWQDRFPSMNFPLLVALPGGGARAMGEGSRSSEARIEISPKGDLEPFHLEGFERGQATASVVLRNGKMLVAGEVLGRRTPESFIGYKTSFRVARYRKNGTLDHSFGKRGYSDISFPMSATPNDLTIDRKGRIVVAGGRCSSSFICVDKHETTQKLTFTRLLPSGRLDRSFGKGGRAVYRFGRYGYVDWMTILGDGRMVADVGALCGDHCYNRQYLVSLRPDGSLDRKFGHGGRLKLKMGSEFSIADVVRSGRHDVLLTGSFRACGRSEEFSVIELNRKGRLNRSFGGGDGILDSSLGNTDYAYSIVALRQKPGTLTLLGSAGIRADRRYGVAMARFNLDGHDGRTAVKPCANQ